MALDKAIRSGKEHRKQYRGSKRIADRLISKGVTVRERGRWTLQRYYGGLRKGMVARIICSECGYPNEKTNFCPNCGADMRGEEDGT